MGKTILQKKNIIGQEAIQEGKARLINGGDWLSGRTITRGCNSPGKATHRLRRSVKSSFTAQLIKVYLFRWDIVWKRIEGDLFEWNGQPIRRMDTIERALYRDFVFWHILGNHPDLFISRMIFIGLAREISFIFTSELGKMVFMNYFCNLIM